MKTYLYLLFFCTLQISSVMATPCLSCIINLFTEKEPNTYNPALLIIELNGGLILPKKEMDFTINSFFQYFSACPMEDDLPNFSTKKQNARTNNSLFIQNVEELNELQICINPVTPSVILRTDDYYSIGFEVYVGEKDNLCKDQNSNLQFNQNFCWFFVINVRYSPNFETLFVLYVLSKLDNEPPEVEWRNINLGKDLILKNEDIESFYSMENQITVFSKIFPSSEERLEYFDLKVEKYLEKQFLAEPKDFYYEIHRDATFTYANVVPMWKSIKMGAWKQLSEMLRNLVYKNDYFLILVGTYGTMKLSKEDVFLAEKDKMPVPLAFWKFLRFIQHVTKGDNIEKVLYHEIFIVIHNNPYDNDPEILCPNVGEKYGWSKINSENNETGFTYCCEASEEIMKKFDVSHYLSRTTDNNERVIFNLQDYEKGNFMNSTD